MVVIVIVVMVIVAGIYLTMVMVMTAISIVISVIVLDLHHHEPTSPVPAWMGRIVFGFMARLMCMKVPGYQEQSPGVFHGRGHHTRTSYRTGSHHGTQPHHAEEENAFVVEDNSLHDGINHFVKNFYDDLDSVIAPKKRVPLFDEILQHLREMTNRMKRNIKREQIKEEWKLLAKVLDRFLLIVFLLVITGLTVTILYIYPTLAMHSEHHVWCTL